MFTSYYGLDKNIFNNEINVREAYKSNDYNNMISRLEYLREIKGIGLFTGPEGSGRTFILRCFKELSNEDLYKIIYISPTKLSVFEFLNALCIELGIDTGSCYRNEVEHNIQLAIKKIKRTENKDVVVIIDNVQNANSETLLELKLLYDFDMESMDYMSIVLCGNDNILSELKKSKYDALRQRLIIKYEMSGLSEEETKEYIKSRLELCGQEYDIFTDNAKFALYRTTHGNIRKLNTMIQNCLIIGMQQGKKEIDEEIVSIAKGEADM